MDARLLVAAAVAGAVDGLELFPRSAAAGDAEAPPRGSGIEEDRVPMDEVEDEGEDDDDPFEYLSEPPGDLCEELLGIPGVAVVALVGALCESHLRSDRTVDLRRTGLAPRHAVNIFGMVRPESAPTGFLVGLFGLDAHGLGKLEGLIGPTLLAASGRAAGMCILDPREQILLTLYWLRTGCALKTSCTLANCVQSTGTKYTSRVLNAIIDIVGAHSSGEVFFPSARRRAFFAELVRDRLAREDHRFPAGNEDLSGVYAFLDGTHIAMDRPGDHRPADQVAYKGRKSFHTCNNQLLVSPTGETIAASLNYPGSFHDSDHTRASGIYARVRSAAVAPPNVRVLADSAYEACPGVAVPGQAFVPLQGRRMIVSGDARNEPRIRAQHAFLRSGVEWHMGYLKQTFSILSTRLTANNARRDLIITACVILGNFRVRVNRFDPNELWQVYVGRYRGDMETDPAWADIMAMYRQ